MEYGVAPGNAGGFSGVSLKGYYLRAPEEMQRLR